MPDKNAVLESIFNEKIIAVLRAPDARRTRKLADAIIRGGINLVEITMNVPDALDIIRGLVSDNSGSRVIIGAGTVLDAGTARLAILAGAEYIVSPHFNMDVVRMSQQYDKVCIPGAMSPKEIHDVMTSDADLIKVFPACFLGPDFIKEIRGPYPQAMMVPSTGVTLENVEEWFKAGAVAVFVGSDITGEALEKDDYSIAEKRAREYIKRLNEINQSG